MAKPPKKPAKSKPQTKLDWLLTEREEREKKLGDAVGSLNFGSPAARNATPCEVATAVYQAATEYVTAAGAVLIAAHEVYTYALAVRQAAQEEMSVHCTPNG
jgi:hypothetical protein